jgi:hypothetical protein
VLVQPVEVEPDRAQTDEGQCVAPASQDAAEVVEALQ